jgi:RND superfamily putative drug exporter
MLARLGAFAGRRPWRIVAVAALGAALAVAAGGGLTDGLTSGGFQDPGSETLAAQRRIASAAGVRPGAGIIALVRPGAPVASPVGRTAVERVAARIARDPAVGLVTTAFTGGGRALVSFDGTATYVVASFRDISDDAAEDAAARLEAAFAGDPAVTLGGGAVAGNQVGDIVRGDLARAELLAFPLLLLLSLWVFRGVVAALLPPLMGAVVIAGAMLGLGLANRALAISVYALNLVIGLSLGLAIDYSLLVVSRYREEIAARGPGVEALRRTLATAGRSVLFSAVTVAAALAGLMVFPQRFLVSMGLGGVMVALLAAAVSLVLLPAVLALLGRRVNALAPRAWRRRTEEADHLASSGGWYRLSRLVMRRPGPIAGIAAAGLIALGLPALGVTFTTVDATVLPESASARQVRAALRTEFPQDRAAPIFLAVTAPRTPAARARLEAYARDLAAIPGVTTVDPPQPLGPDTWAIDVIPAQPALSERSQDVVRAIRAREAPYPVLAGGLTANFLDEKASIAAHLPLAVAVVAGVTVVALFLMTGSVVLPLKAVVMNLLTLTATIGALVLIFQEGRLEDLLRYTSQGGVDLTQPILLGALAFGLSTDYAVFLLSRIAEAREAGASDTEAVAIGLQRTGRIVTAAALLFCVAIAAFATSDIVIIKELGVGTALAVALDATVVRAALVPSLMALLGRWNWWAPGPLRRVHRRLGLGEGEASPGGT